MQPLLQRSQAILLVSDFQGLMVAMNEAMAAGLAPVVREIKSGIPPVITGMIVNNDSAAAAAEL